MSFSALIFYVFGGLLIGAALLAVTVRNIFHAALWLMAALGSVAGLFMLLGADFLAVAQLLLYVGGIMVILLFVVMLSAAPGDQWPRQTNDQKFFAFLVSVGLAVGLGKLFCTTPFQTMGSDLLPTTQRLGRLLLTKLLLPFEAVSLALVAALVGAILFTQKQKEE